MEELFNMIYVTGDKTATVVNMFIICIALLIIHDICKSLAKF